MHTLPLYHYSVGKALLEELNGSLNFDWVDLEESELGVIWFAHSTQDSSNGKTCWLGPYGYCLPLLGPEKYEPWGGLYRWRLSASCPTVSFQEYKETSGVTDVDFLLRVDTAINHLDDPFQNWRVSFKPVPLSETTGLEQWDGMNWVSRPVPKREVIR